MNSRLESLGATLPPPAQVQLYSAVAQELCRGGNWNDADNYFCKAIELASTSDDPDLADLYKARGTLLYRMGRWHEALQTYEQGLGLLQRNAPTSTSAILNCIGLQQYSLGNWVVATSVLESAIATARSSRERLYAECNLAMLTGERGWHKESMIQSEGIAEQLRELGDGFGAAVALTNALYMAALLQDPDKCYALESQCAGCGDDPRLERLAFGILDSKTALALGCRDLDEGGILVDQMKRLAGSDVPWYFSGAQAWALIREANWHRLTGDPRHGRHLLSQRLQQGP